VGLSELEEVPLTEQEKSDIAEAWLGYLHALPAGAEPDMQGHQGGGVFIAIVNRILAVHDFEPFTAAFRWGADQELILLARRLPSTRRAE
jgi:hypothetical protein